MLCGLNMEQFLLVVKETSRFAIFLLNSAYKALYLNYFKPYRCMLLFVHVCMMLSSPVSL